MPVLIWGVAISVLAFWLHVLIWRVRLPRKQTRALLGLFLGCLAAGLVALWMASRCGSLPFLYLPSGPAQYVHVALLVVSFTLGYIITYSALEADSPSLLMVMAITNAGPGGLDHDEFERTMSDDLLIRPRIRDLVRDGMIVSVDGRYRLTPKGRRFVQVFVTFRGLLGAPKGG